MHGNPQRPQFTPSERETETGKVKLRNIVMFASEVDQLRFWGTWSLVGLNSSAAGQPGEQVQSPGMLWEGQLLEEAERHLDWRLTSEWPAAWG